MSLLSRLFGPKPHPSAGAPTQWQQEGLTAQAPVSPMAMHRELLRVVLRDTLNRHGIPTAWIGAEMLVAHRQGHEAGMHLRLLIRHWEPRLLVHCVALQRSLREHVVAFDPQSQVWFMGVSWQFALDDESACPEMPPPIVWKLPSEVPAHTPVPLTRPPRFEATQPQFRPTEPAGL